MSLRFDNIYQMITYTHCNFIVFNIELELNGWIYGFLPIIFLSTSQVKWKIYRLKMNIDILNLLSCIYQSYYQDKETSVNQLFEMLNSWTK